VLSDGASWLNAALPDLIAALWHRGRAVRWIHNPAQLTPGDVCLLLSCSRVLRTEQLALHSHNLVVHESDLPKDQGWSPMPWQILEGARSIPVTLFEATADLDAGPIHLQQQIALQGHRLVKSGAPYRPMPPWSSVWPGSIATARWSPQPSPSRVRPPTTAAVGRPIPSSIPNAPWRCSSTYCGW